MRDDDVRASCFAQLAILCAEHGEDVPYAGGLDRGFTFRGRRVPYLNYQKGSTGRPCRRGRRRSRSRRPTSRPMATRRRTKACSTRTGPDRPTSPNNRALRAAFELQVPVVHFVGTRPGWYRPSFPAFVAHDDPASGFVLVAPGKLVGPLDEREPVPVEDPIERRYLVRQTRVRMHQAQFRGRVLPAYSSRCAICRLRESRLLDAAHIIGDVEDEGEAVVPNGMSLCSIHHRAFDQHLLGVSPEYRVHVSRRLLEDDDGPMLALLKGFHGQGIEVPERRSFRPDRERLALRFDAFRERTAA